MGDNNEDPAAAANNAAAAAANAGRYIYLSFSFQVLLEFLALLFGVDAIDLSCLDAICSTTLLIIMISSSAVYVVIFCQVLVQINSYDNFLIYSTVFSPYTTWLAGCMNENLIWACLCTVKYLLAIPFWLHGR
jgi:hypothetical protein